MTAWRSLVSPYINRFLSADTVVPNAANPQDLNRYSYVRNNPVRYIDPSGHVCTDPEDPTPTCFGTGTARVGNTMIIGNGAEVGAAKNLPVVVKKTTTSGSKVISGGGLITVVSNAPNSGDPVVGVVPPGPSSADPIVSLTTSVPNQSPSSIVESYCGDTSSLACVAMLAQDMATGIDLVGVGLIETPAVAAVGCFEGGPLGCAIAEVGVIATWNVTLNNAETAASSLSLVLTVADDVLNNGGWGENSSTALATWALGLAPLTPSWDLAVDIYASGYNRGTFNGVNTIWTEGLGK